LPEQALLSSIKPALTIAIPTLNRLSLLKTALATALAQTAPVEIIVSDNGSTDGTDSYLRSISLPGHVRRFRHETTMPVQQHGTFLASQVRTEWIVFLSDDDSLEPNFAARVGELISEKPDVTLVYTGCHTHFGNVAVPAKVGPKFESAADFLFGFMAGERNICMCSTAFRTSEYRAIGQQPASVLIGDMYYWTRMLENAGLVGCVDEILAHYFFYQRGLATETNRTSVPEWARESKELASVMSACILADPAFARRDGEVARMRAKFLARTTSLQFVFVALRGARRFELLRLLFQLAAVVSGDGAGLMRTLAAILAPRGMLERAMFAQARRLARQRA
jgi:hypothetical protein